MIQNIHPTFLELPFLDKPISTILKISVALKSDVKMDTIWLFVT